MRKKSSYRPKPVLVNPLGYVLESIKPVSKHDSYLVDLKIKNHGSMTSLTTGAATRDDIEMLVRMVNTAEALYQMGFGRPSGDAVDRALDALEDIAHRGSDTMRFILKAHEMNALNLIMELHDGQLDLITVKHMEQAIELIKENVRLKKTRVIKWKKS